MEIDCSVIVPVYNAEKTVLSTLSSIREIDGINIEIILVDDGSTDASLEICTKQSQLDNRITVFHKENGGVSSARNCGLTQAKGKYIFFADADDTIFPKALETMVSAMDRYNLDLAIADYEEFNMVFNQRKVVSSGLPYNTLLNREYILDEVFRRLYKDEALGLSNIWNKVFNRKFIERNSIEFEIHRTHGEDWKFVIDYLHFTYRLIVLPISLVSYNIDGSQVLSKYRKGLLRSVHDVILIKERIRNTGTFELTRQDEEKVAIEQFIGIIEFIRSGLLSDELIILKKSPTVKKLSRRIMRMSPTSLKRVQASRNLLLIACAFSLGWMNLTEKLIKRGF